MTIAPTATPSRRARPPSRRSLDGTSIETLWATSATKAALACSLLKYVGTATMIVAIAKSSRSLLKITRERFTGERVSKRYGGENDDVVERRHQNENEQRKPL